MFYYFFFIGLLIFNLITDKTLFQSRFYAKLLLAYIVLLVVAIGLKNPIAGDMERYLSYLDVMKNVSLFDSFVLTRWEPGFVLFQWVVSKISSSYILFIPMSIITVLLIMTTSLKKVIPYNKIPLIMFGYLSLFSFYNLLNNILRQGFSIAFLLLMLVYLEKNKYVHATFFLIIAICFHTTAFVGIIIIIFYKMNISLNKYIIIYFITALTLVLNINQNLISLLPLSMFDGAESYIQQYTSENFMSNYGGINRLDFFLFSIFWFFLSLFFYKRYLYNDLFYLLVIKAYAIYGSFFFLFGFISYSDRLAVYSWFLIPLILFYPLINMISKYKIVWITFGITICVVMMYVFNISDYFTVLS